MALAALHARINLRALGLARLCDCATFVRGQNGEPVCINQSSVASTYGAVEQVSGLRALHALAVVGRLVILGRAGCAERAEGGINYASSAR